MTSSSTKLIRVLVVDDSPVIREVIRTQIDESPDMEVVETAGDGKEALEKIKLLHPDVVTLDVQMPNMDGLATLDAMLDTYAVPVIMVSSLTQRGAETALEALDRGAMDYVAKTGINGDNRRDFGEELMRKIRNVAGLNVKRILQIRRERKQHHDTKSAQPKLPPSTPEGTKYLQDFCIAIGISTGGPPALSHIFSELKPPLPPIVVVQHMPPMFTKPLAWRLDSISSLSIKEAADGDIVQPNQVLIAPGGSHLSLRRHAGSVKALISDGETVSGHKPSIDVLMKSVAETYRAKSLAVIMTGMGRDGVEGCQTIKKAGGYVLGQDEHSSDVYGMNKVAFVEGVVDRQFSLDEAAYVITRQSQRLCASYVGVS